MRAAFYTKTGAAADVLELAELAELAIDLSS